MRCYFERGGHIVEVELLPGLSDEEAVKTAHELFESRKGEYEGFEVWEQARKIIQHHRDLPAQKPKKRKPL